MTFHYLHKGIHHEIEEDIVKQDFKYFNSSYHRFYVGSCTSYRCKAYRCKNNWHNNDWRSIN